MGPVQIMKSPAATLHWTSFPSADGQTQPTTPPHLSTPADNETPLGPKPSPQHTPTSTPPSIFSTQFKVFNFKVFAYLTQALICRCFSSSFFRFGMINAVVMRWFQFVVIYWYLYAVLFSSVLWIRVFYYFPIWLMNVMVK